LKALTRAPWLKRHRIIVTLAAIVGALQPAPDVASQSASVVDDHWRTLQHCNTHLLAPALA